MRCDNTSVCTLGEYEVCFSCLPEAANQLFPVEPAELLDTEQSAKDAEETAEAVKEFEPADQDEYFNLVGLLSDSMDAADAADNQRKSLGAPLRKGFEAINARFNTAVKAWEATKKACKDRIAAIRKTQEAAVDAAIKEGKPVPEVFDLPPGLTIKSEIHVVVKNLEDVPEEYLTVAIDTQKVLDAMGADSALEIPGLEKTVEYNVVLRRGAE
jgi:hypothetical protein